MLFPSRLSLLCAILAPAVTRAAPQDSELGDLATYLVNNAIQHEDVFPRAIGILDKLKTSPSCSRVALQGLITECESVGRSSTTELQLEEVREQYAARLAICEVSAAGVAPPKECQVFVSSEHRSKNARNRQTCRATPCFEKLTRRQVKPCLGALHRETQFWTSFSNSLQNVVHVCQASRVWVEKGEGERRSRCTRSDGQALYAGGPDPLTLHR